MRTRLQFPKPTPAEVGSFSARASSSFLAGQLARMYGYPTLSSPSSESVAILELGGGWRQSDLNAYCAKAAIPVPRVEEISVDGARNTPVGDPNSADGEVALDMQCIAGATGGMVGLTMYWARNTGPGFANAIARVAQDNRCCALSISWGLNERGWSATDQAAMDVALKACWDKGIVVFSASGDDGSGDGAPGNNVDYPSSSPWCIGCGGTTVTANGESAWSYGGGGLSTEYARPTWQLIGGNSRGIPDIAGVADPATGYQTLVDGRWGVIGGTSAVSPMWSALVALIVSKNGGRRLTDFASRLYTGTPLSDVLLGSNGAYRAGPGWDPCTGLGTPNKAFVDSLLLPANPPPATPPPSGTVVLPSPIILPAGTYQVAR